MKTLLKVIALNTFLLITGAAFAQRVGLGVHIQIGPPEPRQEIIVERPYPEAIWVPGYYDYDYGTRNYIWVGGRWQRPPHRGARWVAPAWRHERGEYRFHRGRWR